MFLNENKGFKYCFEAVMLQMYSDVVVWGCEYCLGSGVKKDPPPLFFQTVQGLMALDNLLLQTRLCTAQETEDNKTKKSPEWC